MELPFNINRAMWRLRSIRAQILPACIIAFVLLASILFFREARGLIGKPFPGFLTFENGMVGAFGSFDWPGYEMGLRYHDIVVAHEGADRYRVLQDGQARTLAIAQAVFSLKDFLFVFFAPFASGIFYLVAAGILFLIGRHARGIVPFACFHAGVAYYLIASFDFHWGHRASWFFLLNFAMLPAAMTHFALVFPEATGAVRRHRWLVFLPYALSLAIAVPYIATSYRDPAAWLGWERATIAYVIASYFFWIAMLARQARSAVVASGRIAAAYVLLGQLVAFLIPLTAAVAIFLFQRNVPLNLIAPVTIVLPIASLFGIVLGNLRNAQLALVESEKLASLGRLVAGVAHEINNPTTFIASNVPMLREYAGYLRTQVRTDAAKFRGEMTAGEVVDDLAKAIDTVAEGASRIRDIVADLRRFGHTQEETAAPVDLHAGIESTLHLLAHEIGEQVEVQMQVPEGLRIQANAGQINQVWMNLLANALAAIEGPGHIWIEGHGDRDRVEITVRDDGRGMSREVAGHVFDPFFTTKPEGEGTGLGLAICQQIVHRWGGTIDVSSQPGRGTAFRVAFPAWPRDREGR
jgi:signal transduction histidine kinase